ncbi:MAG: anti-sigma F factor [Halanaerobium sp.]|nr:anti-sigma F factor [Halanaerobium sp.]
MPENYARLEFSGSTANLGLARVAGATFAGNLEFTLTEIEEIKVALSEAVSNAIIHGYDEDPAGKVLVEFHEEGRGMKIIVEDRGRGMEATETEVKDEDRLGLGLTFIKAFMDRLDIITEPGQGTRLEMYKLPARVENTVRKEVE